MSDALDNALEESIKQISEQMDFKNEDLHIYSVYCQINQFLKGIKSLEDGNFGMVSYVVPEIKYGTVYGYEYRVISDSTFGIIAEFRKGRLMIDDAQRVSLSMPTEW